VKERIYWIPASAKLPDDEMTVMVYHPTLNEPVWLGYHNQGFWYTPSGEPLPENTVTHWAEMPEGPVKK
jgi:hypothetical protein